MNQIMIDCNVNFRFLLSQPKTYSSMESAEKKSLSYLEDDDVSGNHGLSVISPQTGKFPWANYCSSKYLRLHLNQLLWNIWFPWKLAKNRSLKWCGSHSLTQKVKWSKFVFFLNWLKSWSISKTDWNHKRNHSILCPLDCKNYFCTSSCFHVTILENNDLPYGNNL